MSDISANREQLLRTIREISGRESINHEPTRNRKTVSSTDPKGYLVIETVDPDEYDETVEDYQKRVRDWEDNRTERMQDIENLRAEVGQLDLELAEMELNPETEPEPNRTVSEWVYGGLPLYPHFDYDEFKEVFFRHRLDATAVEIHRWINQRIFMVINSKSKGVPYVMLVKDALNLYLRNQIVYPTTEQFNSFFDGFEFKVGETKEGADKTMNIWKMWQKWCDRRTINQIVFHPGMKPGFEPERKLLNTWQGFPYYQANPPPLTNADNEVIQMFRHHVEDILCKGEPTIIDYVTKWMAWVRQHPGEKSEVVPIFIGPQGSGKSFAIRAFLSLFHEAGSYVDSQDDMFGQFAAAAVLDNKIIVGCDEIQFWDQKTMNKLKNLITNKERRSENKYFTMHQIPNFLNFLFSANPHKKLIPLSQGINRRFILIYVADTYLGEKEYFTKFSDTFLKGPDDVIKHNLQLIDHWLVSMDLSGFDIRNAPVTDIMVNQIITRLSPIEKWWIDKLENRVHSEPVDQAVMDRECPTWTLFPVKMENLHRNYQYDNPKNQMTMTEFKIALIGLCPFKEEGAVYRFPAHSVAYRWRTLLGGKTDVVQIQSTPSMTLEQATASKRKRVTDNAPKNKRAYNRTTVPGQMTMTNFFSNQ